MFGGVFCAPHQTRLVSNEDDLVSAIFTPNPRQTPRFSTPHATKCQLLKLKPRTYHRSEDLLPEVPVRVSVSSAGGALWATGRAGQRPAVRQAAFDASVVKKAVSGSTPLGFSGFGLDLG